MSKAQDRLDVLEEFTKRNRHARDQMVGALSFVCSDEDWAEALETVKHLTENDERHARHSEALHAGNLGDHWDDESFDADRPYDESADRSNN